MNNLSGRTPAFCAGKFARRALQSVVLVAVGRIRLTSLRQDLPPVRLDRGISSMPRNFLFCFALIFSIVSDAYAALDSLSPTTAAAWRNSYSGTNYPTQRAAADAACATGGMLFNYYLPWGTDGNGVVTTWQVYCAGTGHQYGGVWQASAAVCPTPTAQPTIPYAWNPSNGMCERSIVAPCPAHSHGTPPSCVCDAGYKFGAAGTSCVPEEQYTISLQIPPPAEVVTGATKSAYAQVTRSDGTAKDGVNVDLLLTVEPENGEPVRAEHVGGISPNGGATGADGKLSFVFTAPTAGGTHTITATCTGCANVMATGTITVSGCTVDPLTEVSTLSELAGETPEQADLTKKLEDGMDGYSLLSPATQAAEQCLAVSV